MVAQSRLGAYLRARRELVLPEDAGLPPSVKRRRVPGLRREEVAGRAGISTEYYLRLEQGREAQPSKQVLDSLARALLLDDVAAAYLHGLARPSAAGIAEPRDAVDESVQWLIDSWPMTAAVVHNRYIDVLATNALARALSPNYRVGVNNLLSLLVDPADREFHDGWEALSARSVALLRSMFGQRGDDERLRKLVEGLTVRSERFRELWGRNDVIEVSNGVHVVRHPLVGPLTLHFTRLPLIGTDGHTIFLYHAKPNTLTAERLAVLAAME
ncbi:XRE family transcriptional regulator [Cryobacterium adonitolivorans]|uniref:XRE family transcriptional regulator n=1 Tax=Cryobacterium adonitolivorans TaxID=1259189 RepID=A0A4R8W3J4_9MICO|nr:helix-turn-helix transcriptional regulator [Cryobacterium adonitolivorans]TFC01029.1 XRE family transcriptional regulator [Cryobacterium adonitolivorans]